MDINFNVQLILLHIIILFTLVIEQVVSADFRFEACKPKTCGNNPTIIKYPFWIQDDYCGQPGFGVTCKNSDPILHTSGYGYIIREIDYENKSFRVENPVLQDKECPVPLQNSTFSDQSPFKSGFNVQELSFYYNCSNYQPGRFGPITYPVTSSCASSSTDDKLVSFAIPTPPKDFVMDPLICESLVRVPVEMETEPSLGPDAQGMDYMLLLKKGFILGWDKISCAGCEESGGYCGFDKSSVLVCYCKDQPHYDSCNVASIAPGAVVDKPTVQASRTNTRKKIRIGVIVGGIVVGLGIGLATFICLKKRSTSRNFNADMENWDMSMEEEFQKGKGPKRFSYNELGNATGNFDERRKLGQGGFGGVYKGSLGDMNIAVKRISKGSQQGKKEYQSEVKIISQLRHRNLVQLIGWCHERNEMLLVYEFMPNRSLDKHLFQGENSLASEVRCKNKGLSKHPFQGENVLAWEVRYKITLGLASALLYLHEEWEQCVVHRDIKSSNIMLDSDFNAKLGDFGLARLVDHGKGSETTAVAGTRGYLAPECFITGKFSKESDIYSFGIVALEIACGRKPAEIGKLDLVEWVWGLYGSGKIAEAADERCMEFNELQMKHLMVVGLWCAHPDYKSRPSITQVINVLKFESPLPVLPLELPTPVYLSALPAIPDLLSVGGLTNTLNGR